MHAHHIALALAAAALAPASAAAQPIHDVGITTTPYAQARQDLRPPDVRDAADGRGTFNSPRVVVVKTQPQPAQAHSDGMDWADAGIGAGGLVAIAAGGALLLTLRRRAARPAGV
jgi:hypothetical protein